MVNGMTAHYLALDAAPTLRQGEWALVHAAAVLSAASRHIGYYDPMILSFSTHMHDAKTSHRLGLIFTCCCCCCCCCCSSSCQGGTGRALVQALAIRGVKVIATCSTHEKRLQLQSALGDAAPAHVLLHLLLPLTPAHACMRACVPCRWCISARAGALDWPLFSPTFTLRAHARV